MILRGFGLKLPGNFQPPWKPTQVEVYELDFNGVVLCSGQSGLVD